MKKSVKTIGITLLLALLVLCGCKTETTEKTVEITETPETEQQEENAQEENVQVESVQVEPSYEIKMETKNHRFYSEENPEIELVHYDYKIPVMTVDTEEGQVVADAFNALFQPETKAGRGGIVKEAVSWAEEDYKYRIEEGYDADFNPYEIDETYDFYQKGNLVSVFGTIYSYTGGAHGNGGEESYLFDTNLGESITVLDLVKNPDEFIAFVADTAIKQADEVAKAAELEPIEFYWPDYADIIGKWNEYSASCLKEDGMQISFSPYVLACYAAGTQTYSIPYEELTPYLKDEIVETLELE